MNKPLVTVIIATYKREQKLLRAIKSILNQTYENIELIIINDDSENDISNLLKFDEKVILINHKLNKGGAGARNTGIREAKGKYIAFLDDDDFFFPKKIEKAVNKMEILPDDYFGLYSSLYSKNEKNLCKLIRNNLEGDLTYQLLTEFDSKFRFGGSSSLFIRKDCLKLIGGFDESFKRHQDFELLLRLFQKGKIAVIKEPLFIKDQNGINYPSIREHIKIKNHYLNKFNSLILSQGSKRASKIYSIQYIPILFRILINTANYRLAFKIFKCSFILSPIFFLKNAFLKIVSMAMDYFS